MKTARLMRNNFFSNVNSKLSGKPSFSQTCDVIISRQSESEAAYSLNPGNVDVVESHQFPNKIEGSVYAQAITHVTLIRNERSEVVSDIRIYPTKNESFHTIYTLSSKNFGKITSIQEIENKESGVLLNFGNLYHYAVPRVRGNEISFTPPLYNTNPWYIHIPSSSNKMLSTQLATRYYNQSNDVSLVSAGLQSALTGRGCDLLETTIGKTLYGVPLFHCAVRGAGKGKTSFMVSNIKRVWSYLQNNMLNGKILILAPSNESLCNAMAKVGHEVHWLKGKKTTVLPPLNVVVSTIKEIFNSAAPRMIIGATTSKYLMHFTRDTGIVATFFDEASKESLAMTLFAFLTPVRVIHANGDDAQGLPWENLKGYDKVYSTPILLRSAIEVMPKKMVDRSYDRQRYDGELGEIIHNFLYADTDDRIKIEGGLQLGIMVRRSSWANTELDGSSRRNSESVRLVLNEITNWVIRTSVRIGKLANEVRIGILTPYEGQKKMYESFVSDLRMNKWKIDCLTFGVSEGKTFDLVIVDMVYPYSYAFPRTQINDVLVNLTRASVNMVLVGDFINTKPHEEIEIVSYVEGCGSPMKYAESCFPLEKLDDELAKAPRMSSPLATYALSRGWMDKRRTVAWSPLWNYFFFSDFYNSETFRVGKLSNSPKGDWGEKRLYNDPNNILEDVMIDGIVSESEDGTDGVSKIIELGLEEGKETNPNDESKVGDPGQAYDEWSWDYEPPGDPPLSGMASSISLKEKEDKEKKIGCVVGNIGNKDIRSRRLVRASWGEIGKFDKTIGIEDPTCGKSDRRGTIKVSRDQLIIVRPKKNFSRVSELELKDGVSPNNK